MAMTEVAGIPVHHESRDAGHPLLTLHAGGSSRRAHHHLQRGDEGAGPMSHHASRGRGADHLGHLDMAA